MRRRQRGGIASGVMIAIAVCAGLSKVADLAISIFDRNVACHQAEDDSRNGTSLSPVDLNDCYGAMQKNLSDAAAIVKLVPGTSDVGLMLAPLSALTDTLSLPPPTANAPLPADVVEPSTSSGGLPGDAACEALAACVDKEAGNPDPNPATGYSDVYVQVRDHCITAGAGLLMSPFDEEAFCIESLWGADYPACASHCAAYPK
jgi:hypothetical protein